MDFGALAARLAVNIEDVRACLLMSRDGLTLGVYPKEQEEMAREIWDRLQSIGDPDRGFLTVRDELWILARRGPYAGIVVASAAATPGLLLDRLEFTLRAAEELRMQDGSASPGHRTEATRRPRTPLHRDPAATPVPPPAEARVPLRPARSEAEAEAEAEEAPPEPAPMLDLSSPDPAAAPEETEEPAREASRAPRASEAGSPGDDGPLDPVRAAMEFANMTGAVGAIPTMPRREAADPAPTGRARSEPEEPGDDGGDVPPLLELEDLRPVDEPAVEDPPPPPAAEGELGPEAPERPEPLWSPEDDAEVDPVALAREFAQLVNDDDKEAR